MIGHRRTATKAIAAAVAASYLALCLPAPARADNPMGYQLLTAQQAAQLPRRGGVLGIDVGAAQQITDGGLAFELLRVKAVRSRSPGAQAGIGAGDQIIAVDGAVFPSVAAFAAYVGSVQPGRQIIVDYIPAGGGPQQAQRVAITLAAGNAATVQPDPHARSTGLSTGSKVAIGLGAAALFGCYELGCFSHRATPPASPQPAVPRQP